HSWGLHIRINEFQAGEREPRRDEADYGEGNGVIEDSYTRREGNNLLEEVDMSLAESSRAFFDVSGYDGRAYEMAPKALLTATWIPSM
ncbi:MAG: hypothetical protein Q9170_001411, partial [Blastenia crenularia]